MEKFVSQASYQTVNGANWHRFQGFSRLSRPQSRGTADAGRGVIRLDQAPQQRGQRPAIRQLTPRASAGVDRIVRASGTDCNARCIATRPPRGSVADFRHGSFVLSLGSIQAPCSVSAALSTPGPPSHKPILTSTLFFVFGKAARSAIKADGQKMLAAKPSEERRTP